MQETVVRFLGWEDPLQKGEVTYSSSGLEIFMDYLGHGVTKKWARLSDLHFHFHLYV